MKQKFHSLRVRDLPTIKQYMFTFVFNVAMLKYNVFSVAMLKCNVFNVAMLKSNASIIVSFVHSL